MKTNPNPRVVYSINNRRDKINIRPDYQRGLVWTKEKQQLLIDTILRGYDIPKFYFRIVDGQYEYEVVDGQQRLTAIWDFVDNKFPLGKYSSDLPACGDLSGKFHKELSSDLQDVIGSFQLTITEIRDSNEIEIRDLFQRLQNGTTLNPAEKRNAMPGKMRDFVNSFTSHKLFKNATINETRFKRDDYMAHVIRLELNHGPVNLKSKDLEKMYKDEKKFDSNSIVGKKINKVINYMSKVFGVRTPELKIKWGFVDMYLLTSYLLNNYSLKKKHIHLYNFFVNFEKDRKSISDPSLLLSKKNEWDKDLYDYIQAFKSDGALRESIQVRHEVYLKRFLKLNKDLVAKDPKRNFTETERIVIWREASMKCKECEKRIELSEMHADHKNPHSNGGQTKISNGQCLCSSCNLKKSDRIK